MKPEKYDRFENDGEVIEFTGLYRRDMGDRLPVFKVIAPIPGYDKGDVKIYAKGVFERSGFKKLLPGNHPVVLEAVKLTREQPELREQFAKALAIQFSAASPSEKKQIANLLKKYLPKELKAELCPGEKCRQCKECSRRIWRVDHI